MGNCLEEVLQTNIRLQKSASNSTLATEVFLLAFKKNSWLQRLLNKAAWSPLTLSKMQGVTFLSCESSFV